MSDTRYIVDVDTRIRLYQNIAQDFKNRAFESYDENSRKHWMDRAREYEGMVRELKGA